MFTEMSSIIFGFVLYISEFKKFPQIETEDGRSLFQLYFKEYLSNWQQILTPVYFPKTICDSLHLLHLDFKKLLSTSLNPEALNNATLITDKKLLDFVTQTPSDFPSKLVEFILALSSYTCDPWIITYIFKPFSNWFELLKKNFSLMLIPYFFLITLFNLSSNFCNPN